MRSGNRTVYVAMSGGVDSSVAAALLKKRGFRVVGVFFKPWSPEPETSNQQLATSFCDWQLDRQDAMRVAAVLGIPFKTWDFSRQYGRLVASYMIEAYRRGITPNPDVMCNKEIKFGLFLKKALAEGADYIATGHYVRLKCTSDANIRMRANDTNSTNRKMNKFATFASNSQHSHRLFQAKDKNKDQSYFLWTLTQEQLKYCLFPIGDYTKPAVRQLAKKLGLLNWNKKDSQGVCFVGELDMKDFLKERIRPKEGEIKLVVTGKTIGYHDGACYYTIGQRHGLNIGNGGGPYYVVAKDIKKNLLYVTGDESDLAEEKTLITKVNWINSPVLPIKARVKIRYRADSVSATIATNGENQSVTVKFARPTRAVTPGQSAVFYRGQVVLGGGVIR